MLSRVSDSVEELTLVSEDASLVVAESRLPCLRALRYPYVASLQPNSPGQMQFIQNHPKITHFIISVSYSNSLSTPPPSPDVLPNLKHLTGGPYAARIFAPGRPVQTYYQEVTSCFMNTRILKETLVSLGKSTGPVTRLRLAYLPRLHQLFQLISTSLPQLESLQLYIRRDLLESTYHTGELPAYDYLLGKWPSSPVSCALNQALGLPHLTSLKEIEIRFVRLKEITDVYHPFPRIMCESIFHDVLINLCPRLQVAEFLSVLRGEKFSEEVELTYRMKMQRLSTGEWEERKWA
jgi:hypothetical protein